MECKSQREAMVQPTEVFPFPVLMCSNHRGGSSVAPLKLQLLRQHLAQITHCAHVTTAPSITNLYETKAHSLPLQQIKPDISAFLTGLSPYLHFSLPSLQNQRKTSLRFENMAWWQGKICRFWFKHLFWKSKIMLSSFFMASKNSHTVQLWPVGLLWGFALWGAGMVQTVSAHIWALNTDLKLHHKETTDVPRVHWSLLTALWEIKKYWIPNVTFLNWKLPKML